MTSSKNVIKKLFDLQPDLQVVIEEHESDVVRHALVHIREGINHLADAMAAEEAWQR